MLKLKNLLGRSEMNFQSPAAWGSRIGRAGPGRMVVGRMGMKHCCSGCLDLNPGCIIQELDSLGQVLFFLDFRFFCK